ncbi:MAG: hypothetical protein IPF99_35155 [Deltaproteobacteria bacterium]|nr:hypothetical protein [Deltaproteobacteria bacterium]
MALSNYLLFFGPGLWQALRARQRKATQVVEAHREAQEPARRGSACARPAASPTKTALWSFACAPASAAASPPTSACPRAEHLAAAAAPAEPT